MVQDQQEETQQEQPQENKQDDDDATFADTTSIPPPANSIEVVFVEPAFVAIAENRVSAPTSPSVNIVVEDDKVDPLEGCAIEVKQERLADYAQRQDYRDPGSPGSILCVATAKVTEIGSPAVAPVSQSARPTGLTYLDLSGYCTPTKRARAYTPTSLPRPTSRGFTTINTPTPPSLKSTPTVRTGAQSATSSGLAYLDLEGHRSPKRRIVGRVPNALPRSTSKGSMTFTTTTRALWKSTSEEAPGRRGLSLRTTFSSDAAIEAQSEDM